MSVIDDYLAGLNEDNKKIISHMCGIVRQMVPAATEELSYAMPAFKYKGKGLVAIIANKNFLSLYPFGSIKKLGVDVAVYDQTTGSIHFSADAPMPDSLLRQIIAARMRQIDAGTEL